MENSILKEYKTMLIDTYRDEYDNNAKKKEDRHKLLNSKYSDDYLMRILKTTFDFSKSLIGYLNNSTTEYVKISLECEPEINYIDLNLLGGTKSDTIVHDSNNNLYSILLLNKIFNNSLLIEPCRVEYCDDVIDYGDYSILSQTEKYFLYVQKQEKQLKYDKFKILIK